MIVKVFCVFVSVLAAHLSGSVDGNKKWTEKQRRWGRVILVFVAFFFGLTAAFA